MSDIGFIIEFEFDIIGRGYGIEVSGRMRGSNMRHCSQRQGWQGWALSSQDSDISHNLISCPIMPNHVISCQIMSYHAISCHIMPYHAISCHIMPYHVISCHIMSYQWSYHVPSFFAFHSMPGWAAKIFSHHVAIICAFQSSLTQLVVNISNLLTAWALTMHFMNHV